MRGELLQRSDFDRLGALVKLGADFGGRSDAVSAGGPIACGFRGGVNDNNRRAFNPHLLDFRGSGDCGLGRGCRDSDWCRGGALAQATFIKHGADFGGGGNAVTTAGGGASSQSLPCRGEKRNGRGSDKEAMCIFHIMFFLLSVPERCFDALHPLIRRRKGNPSNSLKLSWLRVEKGIEA